MADLFQISKQELLKIIGVGRETAVIETLTSLGMLPSKVSKNKAEKILGSKTALKKFIENGDIKPYTPIRKVKTKGEKSTSTVLFDYARLIELKNLERIIVYK